VSAPESPEGGAGSPVDTATSTDGTPAEGAGTEEGTTRRGLKRSTKIALTIIVLLALLAAAAFAANYFINSSKVVSTDNAQIDGTQIPIVAPTSGTLVGWTGSIGAVLRRDQVVGRVQQQGAYVQPQLPIRAPAAGTIANSDTTEGAYVTAGAQLAIAYDPANVYVTARVDETDINDVEVNQPVDFTVDAYPGRSFHGTVQEIQGGAAAVFSQFPQSNSGGNFQKVTQVIPVRIGIDDSQGLDLIPGMNVTVDIHKPGD
jgi:multidrug resistance efflux pump